jgi:hypothetical protein
VLIGDDDDGWGDFGSKSKSPSKPVSAKAASPASGERKLTKFELAQKRKEERAKKKAGAP